MPKSTMCSASVVDRGSCIVDRGSRTMGRIRWIGFSIHNARSTIHDSLPRNFHRKEHQIRCQPGLADPRLEPLNRLRVLPKAIVVNEDVDGREGFGLLAAAADQILNVL